MTIDAPVATHRRFVWRQTLVHSLLIMLYASTLIVSVLCTLGIADATRLNLLTNPVWVAAWESGIGLAAVVAMTGIVMHLFGPPARGQWILRGLTIEAAGAGIVGLGIALYVASLFLKLPPGIPQLTPGPPWFQVVWIGPWAIAGVGRTPLAMLRRRRIQSEQARLAQKVAASTEGN